MPGILVEILLTGMCRIFFCLLVDSCRGGGETPMHSLLGMSHVVLPSSKEKGGSTTSCYYLRPVVVVVMVMASRQHQRCTAAKIPLFRNASRSGKGLALFSSGGLRRFLSTPEAAIQSCRAQGMYAVEEINIMVTTPPCCLVFCFVFKKDRDEKK